MKNSLLLALTMLPFIVNGQKQKPLSDILWDRVKTCQTTIIKEYQDLDEKPTFDIIDDSKNGYLKISGSWPTCGCSCSSTVGAYKNNKGEFTVLQSENFLCDWHKKISSNRNLEDILPNEIFKEIISPDVIIDLDYPIFFVDFEIPRIGTDTKMKIKLIPLGIKADGNKLFCYEYQENQEKKTMYEYQQLANKITDNNTLKYIMNGKFSQICEEDNKIISEIIDNSDNNSKHMLQTNLILLHNIYDIYKELKTDELTLGWDRNKSRFYIKKKGEKPKNISFKEFLINAEYFDYFC